MKNLIIVALLACAAFAQQTIWDGTVDTSWFVAEKDSFEISTPQQLAGVSLLVNNGNNFAGKFITLTSDIVLNETTGWLEWEKTPPTNAWTQIGVYNVMIPRAQCNGFSGTFDGNNKNISGMYIDGAGNKMKSAALFGYLGVGGVITGVKMSEFFVFNEGILTASVVGANLGKIQNCEVANGNISGGLWVGGLTGSSEESEILNNKVICNVTGYKIVGGITGEVNMATVSGNYYEGNVTGQRETGNLVGKVGGKTTKITNNSAKPTNTALTSFGNVKGNAKKAEVKEETLVEAPAAN